MDEILKLLREAIAKAELAFQEYRDKSVVLDQKISIFEDRLYLINEVDGKLKVREAALEVREAEVKRWENLGEAEGFIENGKIALQKEKENFEKWRQAEERRLKDFEDQNTVRRKKLDELMSNEVVRRHLKGLENA